MLRLDLGNARAGMRLALPVRQPRAPQQILLRANYELTQSTIARLPEMGVRSIWVQYPGMAFVEKFLPTEVLESQGEVVQEIGACFEAAQKQATAKLNYNSYTSAISKLVNSLVSNPQAAMYLQDLIGAGADGLMRHSANVAYLSLLMGLKLEGYIVKQRKHINPAQAKEMTSLGVGAMLHDLGVTLLPEDARSRFAQGGDETDPTFQEHTTLGYNLVRGNIEPSAATIVLNHHQRHDGSGYAGGATPALSGERIHVFARIVALADHFDHLHFPPGKPPAPMVRVLRQLLEPDVLAQFDPRVMRALFTVTPPYPPGAVLRLSDGRWASAMDHNVDDPCRPVVQLIGDPSLPPPAQESEEPPLDLSADHCNLLVTQCDGVNVSDFNFEPPPFLHDEALALNWC